MTKPLMVCASWMMVAAVLMPSAWAAPKIEFDQMVYDFGKTSMVQKVTGTFVYTNSGDAELVLQKPTVTCGCTVASLTPDKLAPGEKGELVFNLNVGNVRGRAQKHINVPSNDPDQPNVRLTIQVDVAQTIEVTPGFVNFGQLRAGETTNATVTVQRLDGKPLQLVKVASARPDVQAEIVKSDDQEGTIRVTFAAEGAAQRVADAVQVYTADSAAEAATTVRVMAQVVGDLLVQPERLIWGIGNFDRLPASQLERALTRTVRVSLTRPEQTLQLNHIESSLKDLEVKVISLEEGRVYMLQARFPSIPQDSVNGTITIDTNLKEQPQLQIPVSVNVLRR